MRVQSLGHAARRERNTGLKSIVATGLYAALKRRSSTLLPTVRLSPVLIGSRRLQFKRIDAEIRGRQLTQNNSAIVQRFIEETINQGQIDSAGQFAWEDVVEQVPFPGQGPGLEGLKDVLRGMRAAFPDLHFSVEEQIAEGDKVLTRFEWTGTHRAEFLGVPATGRPVKIWGMVVDRLQGGRIKDTRIIMDSLGLMMQLGVFPPLSSRV